PPRPRLRPHWQPRNRRPPQRSAPGARVGTPPASIRKSRLPAFRTKAPAGCGPESAAGDLTKIAAFAVHVRLLGLRPSRLPTGRLPTGLNQPTPGRTRKSLLI